MAICIYDQEKFKKAVKTIRVIELQESQKNAAKRIGISPMTLMAIENGRPVSSETFLKSCSHLGLDYKDFLKNSIEF